jgi:hypothetical protein
VRLSNAVAKLGAVAAARGEYGQAIAYFEQALTAARKTGGQAVEGLWADSAGCRQASV